MTDLSCLVEPRVTFFEGSERIPISEVIERILDTHSRKAILLDGVDCATALNYVRKHFADNPQIHVSNSPHFRFGSANSCRVWIHTDPNVSSSQTLSIAPWDRDDVIQYMLASNPSQCASVLSRIRPEDFAMVRGGFTVWKCIVDTMLAMQSERDFLRILKSLLMSKLPPTVPSNGNESSMRWLGDQLLIPDSLNRLLLLSDDPVYRTLMQISELRLQIEADRFANLLELSNKSVLQTPRSNELLIEVGKRLIGSTKVADFLKRCVYQSYASMAVSLLSRIESEWKPSKAGSYEFQKAYLAKAQWAGVSLEEVKFGHANLSEICLDDSNLTRSVFLTDRCDKASFIDARLNGTRASKASFVDANFFRAEMSESKWRECDLHLANFAGAKLCKSLFEACNLSETSFRACVADFVDFKRCNLSGADFTDALLHGSHFQAHDLREAVFCRTDLRKTNLHGAVLESVQMQQCKFDDALLSDAYMSGTSLKECSLQRACLVNSRLGEVEWEFCDLTGADLRGVTFHYGSTRCGIVDSPYPSHGTRTGYYTDDREALYFQAPETIRKASLVGCDLRGANISGVDFYLVDLRDAILEPVQRQQIAASGAILG